MAFSSGQAAAPRRCCRLGGDAPRQAVGKGAGTGNPRHRVALSTGTLAGGRRERKKIVFPDIRGNQSPPNPPSLSRT